MSPVVVRAARGKLNWLNCEEVHSEEIHNPYAWTNFVKLIKIWGFAGHVDGIGSSNHGGLVGTSQRHRSVWWWIWEECRVRICTRFRLRVLWWFRAIRILNFGVP